MVVWVIRILKFTPSPDPDLSLEEFQRHQNFSMPGKAGTGRDNLDRDFWVEMEWGGMGWCQSGSTPGPFLG